MIISSYVADITPLNPYTPQNFRADKLSILDVKAKSLEGKLFNIEIQISDEADYDKRALYYWAKLYTEQLQVGAGYISLSKAIGIHILNFISIVEEPNMKVICNGFGLKPIPLKKQKIQRSISSVCTSHVAQNNIAGICNKISIRSIYRMVKIKDYKQQKKQKIQRSIMEMLSAFWYRLGV